MVNDQNVFMDIGAIIGLRSASALRKPGVKIIAIELKYKFKKTLERNLSSITTTDFLEILNKAEVKDIPTQVSAVATKTIKIIEDYASVIMKAI